MRGFLLLLLLSAGAFVAAHSYFTLPTDREAKLAEVTRILAMRAHEAPEGARSYASEGFRSYAPSAAATQQQVSATTQEPGKPQLVAGPARVWRATAAEKQPEERSWAAVVTSDPPVEAKSPLNRIKSLKPSSDDARYELVRDLQKELKRVGCYGGEITGAWGAGSKRAMAAFTERVNASLPVEEPDYVLLALIQAQQSATCSDKCPVGQGRAESGRCVPQAILARAAKKAPVPEAKVATAPRATTSGWSANTRTEPAIAPAPRVAATPSKPPAIAAAPPAPLPGRMTIGGPRPPAALETASVAPAAKAVAASEVAPAKRIAALEPETEVAARSVSQEPASPAEERAAVTDTHPAAQATPPRAPSADRLARKPSRPVDTRRFSSRGYVPPPPHMLGAFYQDKPAYSAARRRW